MGLSDLISVKELSECFTSSLYSTFCKPVSSLWIASSFFISCSALITWGSVCDVMQSSGMTSVFSSVSTLGLISSVSSFCSISEEDCTNLSTLSSCSCSLSSFAPFSHFSIAYSGKNYFQYTGMMKEKEMITYVNSIWLYGYMRIIVWSYGIKHTGKNSQLRRSLHVQCQKIELYLFL